MSLESLLRSERGFRYFSTAYRPGMAKLATFSLASATMQSGLGTCVRVPNTLALSDICHCRMDNNVCFSPIGSCRCSPSAIRPIVHRAVVLSARTFVYTYTRMQTHTREIAPTHLLPPRRKSHRINVRDQRLSISYRAFLSISAAAYNDGDSKAADYEINARLATLATFARVHDLSVFPGEEGEGGWLFATRELSPFAPRRRVSRRRWHFRYPSMNRSDFKRNTSAIQKFSFNFALYLISLSSSLCLTMWI